MNTLELSKKTVKIFSQKIDFDWIHPYKNKHTSQGIGSGFFIDDKGHILTCSHVISQADKIFIEIPHHGDEKIEVNVVGLCPDLDIALLKTVDYKNKDYYKLHNREKIYLIKPGCDVYAIGFPLGQDNIKYTKGIISGRQKSLIQTDTPINPGNSGGPLLLDGKVIGINASKILFASNIGYALPISFYYLIKDLLLNPKMKLIKRPTLGLSYQNSNQALLDVNKCKCKGGVLVKEVFKNSPIKKSGIREGDIICSVNGIDVDNFGLFNIHWFNEKMKLGDILKTVKNGEKINIKYWRNSKLFSSNFKYDDFKLPISMKYPQYEKDIIDYEIFGGIIVMELTDNLLEEIVEDFLIDHLHSDKSNKNVGKRQNNILSYLDYEKKKESRLIITHVFPNSILANLRIIKEFDIIDKINGHKCNNVKDFRKFIEKANVTKGKRYIEILTEINNKVILCVEDLLKEEDKFADTYKYKLSDTYNFFNKNKTNNKNNKNKNNINSENNKNTNKVKKNGSKLKKKSVIKKKN